MPVLLFWNLGGNDDLGRLVSDACISHGVDILILLLRENGLIDHTISDHLPIMCDLAYGAAA